MFNVIVSRSLSVLALLLFTTQIQAASQAEKFKPFILASVSVDKDFQMQVDETKASLLHNGFQLLGEMEPYKDTFVKNAKVLIVTNPELLEIAKATPYGGFAAPWRVSITQTDENVQVATINPQYLKHAYRLKGDLSKTQTDLKTALGEVSTFGSKKGLTARKLAKYHYTIGMERFQNVYILGEHQSHEEALAVLEGNLENNEHGLGKVYRLDLDENVSVFGISRKGPNEKYRYLDDEFIMQTVDFQEHKGTAYLPYEIMVKGNQIIALHMRYRMALHYPDLSMMGKHSFMTLRPSPKEIAWGFSQIANKSAE